MKLDNFRGIKIPPQKTWEDIMTKLFRDGLVKDVELIICDRDLSLMKRLTGLSGNAVFAAASRVGIPICLYVGGGDGDDFFNQKREWGTGGIILKAPPLKPT